jgi:hypothetical protein
MVANKLLDAVSVTGAGSTFNLPVIFPHAPGGLANVTPSQHAIQVTFTESGGTVTALTINIEGSIDEINFTTLISHIFTATEITAKTALFTIIAIPIPLIRANITVLTNTGTAYVSVYHLPGV